jgi:hypothetical protein
MPLMYAENSLQMEWCLSCHREPEKFLRPRDQVFSMTYEQPSEDHPVMGYTNQLALGAKLKEMYHLRTMRDITSCSTCHR